MKSIETHIITPKDTITIPLEYTHNAARFDSMIIEDFRAPKNLFQKTNKITSTSIYCRLFKTFSKKLKPEKTQRFFRPKLNEPLAIVVT